jgi:hypothetical protein
MREWMHPDVGCRSRAAAFGLLQRVLASDGPNRRSALALATSKRRERRAPAPPGCPLALALIAYGLASHKAIVFNHGKR